MRSPDQFGFTLIELLVVFALIALLLTIAVPRYLSTTETAKDRARAQNMATLRDALDKFKADQGRYPNALAEVVQKQYLRHVPMDPVSQSDKWVLVPVPGGAEPGIYDVAPPETGAQTVAEQPASSASAASPDNNAGSTK